MELPPLGAKGLLDVKSGGLVSGLRVLKHVEWAAFGRLRPEGSRTFSQERGDLVRECSSNGEGRAPSGRGPTKPLELYGVKVKPTE